MNCVQARRLSADCVHARGGGLDVFAISEQAPEQTFRHWASTNIARADKEDAFHDDEPAICRFSKL